MKELQWVDVNKVGGKPQWGDRTNLAVGSKAMRPFVDKDGKRGEREETVLSIKRLDSGVHVVVTNAKLPEPEVE